MSGPAPVRAATSWEPSSCISNRPLRNSGVTCSVGPRPSSPWPKRRPVGAWGVGFGPEMGELGDQPIALGLQRVDADVDGRALREARSSPRPGDRRRPRRGRLRASRGNLRPRPAARPSRSRRSRANPLRLFVRGAGSEALAAALGGDLGARQAAGEGQGPEQHGARARIAHDVGGRGTATQRVVDEARDGGAVLRAGEAVGEAPVLQGVGCGAGVASISASTSMAAERRAAGVMLALRHGGRPLP
jgi:hypothetical protein